MTTLTDIPVDWLSLETAFENNAPSVHSFLHSVTGDVLRVVDGDTEPGAFTRIAKDPLFIRVTPVGSREQFAWMEQFIRTVKDPDLKERLQCSVVGPGAFRRFKDAVMAHPEKGDWIAMRREKLRNSMESWLASMSMRPVPRGAADAAGRAKDIMMRLPKEEFASVVAALAAKRCLKCGDKKEACACKPKKASVARLTSQEKEEVQRARDAANDPNREPMRPLKSFDPGSDR